MFKLSRRTAVAAATCLFALSGVVSAAELTGTLKKVQETGSITLGYRESSVPFSYLNADGKPVGYAFTVCQRVADAVKSELGLKTLDVKYQAVTSANRIPLIQNGTVDIECGSTTNSLKRQREAAFSVSYFGIQVSAAVWKSSGIKSLEDLNGKTVTVTSGTTSVALIKEFEKAHNLKIRYLMTKDFAESMQTPSSSTTSFSPGRSPISQMLPNLRFSTPLWALNLTAPCSVRMMLRSRLWSTRPLRA